MGTKTGNTRVGAAGGVSSMPRPTPARHSTRRPRRLPTRFTLAHAAMVTAGLATFVTVGSVLSERGETIDVIVLASDAAPGTSALDLHVRVLPVSVDAPFLGAMVQPDDLVPGLVLAHAGVGGDPLVRSDLVESGSGVLTRTATVALEPVLISGLGLVVGDRVDVIGIDEGDRARFVLHDVRVARLPAAGSAEGLLSGPSASFVTLEVDETDALALVDAQQRGPLQLLRSTGAPTASTIGRPSTSEDRS